MNNYIGVKLVQAEEMTLGAYNEYKGWTIPADEDPNREGYRVHYSDDYVSWCPKEQFEKQNLQIECTDKITLHDVDKFIGNPEMTKLGDKTAVAMFRLGGSFEQVETSACVDPKNYSEEIGANNCIKRAEDNAWHLLGFLLHFAKNGFSKD